MRKKDSPDKGKPGLHRTMFRSPITADVPGEYSYAAEWLPELRTLPDASHDTDPFKDRDPLGFITSEGKSKR